MSKHKFEAYMCGTDFFYEEGQPCPEGNSVYADMETLLKQHPCCKDECGVVKVEVSFQGWALPPTGRMAADGEQIESEAGT